MGTLVKLKNRQVLSSRLGDQQKRATPRLAVGFIFYLSLSSNQIPDTTPSPHSSCEHTGKMGFLGLSKRSADVPASSPTQQDVEKADQQHQQPTVTSDKYDSDTTSDTLSLEARNEREIEQHPDQVTADAHIGVQKAEAAALVWGKPALIFIYAWYRSIPSNPTSPTRQL
jgi:hypothetical protein